MAEAIKREVSEFVMAYGRRYRRRVTRRSRSYSRPRRRSYGRKKVSYRKKRRPRSAPARRTRKPGRRVMRKRRRTKKKFAAPSKGLKRRARLIVPVLKEALKSIADTNEAYNIKDCLGSKGTSVIDEADPIPFVSKAHAVTNLGGPFTLTTDTVEPCGYLGIPLFGVNIGPCRNLMLTTCHPANTLYICMPLTACAFPLIARTNPACALQFNPGNCRESDSCNVISFDNRMSLRITWNAITSTGSGVTLADYLRLQRMHIHEVVYWIPDLQTVEDNNLVELPAAAATDALAEASLRISRTWLRRMYNAYFVNHPLADASVSDVVDVTTGATNIDTFNESLAVGLRISTLNTNIRGRDTKEYLAEGVVDRRKDAKVVWQKRRTFKRPIRKTGFQVHEVASSSDVIMAQETTHLQAGHLFHINRKMVWDKIVPVAVPDTTVREVCPRGVFFYCQYWRFLPNTPSTETHAGTEAPNLAASHTGRADRFQRLRFQTM